MGLRRRRVIRPGDWQSRHRLTRSECGPSQCATARCAALRSVRVTASATATVPSHNQPRTAQALPSPPATHQTRPTPERYRAPDASGSQLPPYRRARTPRSLVGKPAHCSYTYSRLRRALPPSAPRAISHHAPHNILNRPPSKSTQRENSIKFSSVNLSPANVGICFEANCRNRCMSKRIPVSTGM